jgi:hypothetical protein
MRITGLTGVRRRSPETSKRTTRVGIARLASRLSKFAVARHPSNGAMTKISEFALEGHVEGPIRRPERGGVNGSR